MNFLDAAMITLGKKKEGGRYAWKKTGLTTLLELAPATRGGKKDNKKQRGARAYLSDKGPSKRGKSDPALDIRKR